MVELGGMSLVATTNCACDAKEITAHISMTNKLITDTIHLQNDRKMTTKDVTKIKNIRKQAIEVIILFLGWRA